MKKIIATALWLSASSAIGAIKTEIPKDLPDTAVGTTCAQSAADLLATYASIFRFPVHINEVRVLTFESGLEGLYNENFEANIQFVNYHHGIPFEFLNGKARFASNYACDNLKIENIQLD